MSRYPPQISPTSGSAKLTGGRILAFCAAPRLRRLLAGFGLTTALLACGGAVPPSSPRIYGGQAVAPGDLPAVVALTWQGDHDSAPYLSCSGVLIAPQLVLTAGHCLQGPGIDVAKLGSAVAQHLRVYFGPGRDGGNLTPTVAVQSAAYHPLLRAHPLGYADFGLVVLAAPSPVAPLPLRTEVVAQLASLRAGKVELVGYGEREDRNLGRKFQVTAAITGFNSDEAQVGGQGDDACDGDSGGPALVTDTDGKISVLGTVSRGTTPSCGGGVAISLAAYGMCWLASSAGSLYSGPLGSLPDCQAVAPPAGPTPALRFADLCTGGGSATEQETMRSVTASVGAPSCSAAAALLARRQQLNLDYLQLRDLRPLAGFTQLTQLSLRGNRLTDLSPLRALPALQQLDIEGNDVRQLDVLADREAQGLLILGKTRQLWNYTLTPFLSLCQADLRTDPAVAQTVHALRWTAMSDDCAEANTRLLALKTLNLADRQIADLQALAGLTGLISLDLSQNPLPDVHALAGLERLRQLNLQGTPVQDLSPLAPLIRRGLQISR